MSTPPKGITVVRKLLLTVLAVVLAGALVGSAFAASRSVRVGDNWFERARGVPTVTVRRGDTVTWRWAGSAPHNVVVRRGPERFSSKVKTSGTYRRRVTKAGTYTIVCTIHGGSDQSMKLRVR